MSTGTSRLGCTTGNTGGGTEDDQETEAEVMIVVLTMQIVATGAVPAM